MGRKLDGRTRNVTISGFDDIVRDFTKFNDVKKRRKELLKVLDKPATPLRAAIKENTPKYPSNPDTKIKARSKKTAFNGAYMHLKLSSGTLKRSVWKFKAKRSKNPRIDVGHRVLKRPRNYNHWIRNAKKWDTNGWYGLFLLYGTKSRAGNKGIDGYDYLDKTYNQMKGQLNSKMIQALMRYLNKKL